jgi:pantetheine-phosphate adenylyltransferase
MLKQALYAGSFDPWTFGHQFVLDSALEVFDSIHVVSAINPSKQSLFKPEIRARIIAHSIDPFCDWWSQDPPFKMSKGVVVTSQDGLIADYARDNQIKHLIRGLRSTTDFESEFNLYFSNQAINSDLQTWAIMCPPKLLHCSSTYVKTVVGRPHVKFVGTNFISQSLMLGWARIIGQLFDLIEVCSKHRFDIDSFNLNGNDLSECLQVLFSTLFKKSFQISHSSIAKSAKILDQFLKNKGNELRETVIEKHEFSESHTNQLWAILAFCLEQDKVLTRGEGNGVSYLLSVAKNLGKTSIKIFNEKDVQNCYLNFKK